MQRRGLLQASLEGALNEEFFARHDRLVPQQCETAHTHTVF